MLPYQLQGQRGGEFIFYWSYNLNDSETMLFTVSKVGLLFGTVEKWLTPGIKGREIAIEERITTPSRMTARQSTSAPSKYTSEVWDWEVFTMSV